MYTVIDIPINDPEEYIDIPSEHKIIGVHEKKGKIILKLLGEGNSHTVGVVIKCLISSKSYNINYNEHYIGTVKISPFTWNIFIDYVNGYSDCNFISSPIERELSDYTHSVQQDLHKAAEDFQTRINTLENSFIHLHNEPVISTLMQRIVELEKSKIDFEDLMENRFFEYMNSMTTISLITMLCSPTGTFDMLARLNNKGGEN